MLKNNKSITKSKTFTIWMLVVFFPIGAILMWENKFFTRTKRLLITIITPIILLMAFISMIIALMMLPVSLEYSLESRGYYNDYYSFYRRDLNSEQSYHIGLDHETFSWSSDEIDYIYNYRSEIIAFRDLTSHEIYGGDCTIDLKTDEEIFDSCRSIAKSNLEKSNIVEKFENELLRIGIEKEELFINGVENPTTAPTIEGIDKIDNTEITEGEDFDLKKGLKCYDFEGFSTFVECITFDSSDSLSIGQNTITIHAIETISLRRTTEQYILNVNKNT